MLTEAGHALWHHLPKRSSRSVPRIAFYYHHDLPHQQLAQFDMVVLEPDHGFEPPHGGTDSVCWLAYVSVGEVLDHRRYYAAMPQEWLLGRHPDWGGQLIDQSADGWPEFLIEHIVNPLWQAPYQGFFLDTMDSYRLLDPRNHAWPLQKKGLKRIIRLIRQQYPDAYLIINRGFELLDAVSDQLDAVVFESLYQGWDQARQTYHAISAADRHWLLAQVAHSHHLGIPTIALDYCPIETPRQAAAIAQRILRHGLIPSLADKDLHHLHHAIDGSDDCIAGHIHD